MCICMYICICVCVCVYVYVYMYMYAVPSGLVYIDLGGRILFRTFVYNLFIIDYFAGIYRTLWMKEEKQVGNRCIFVNF